MSNAVYDIVTQEIIKKLEEVQASDYKKPWFNVGSAPFNIVSKKAYRGINYMLLAGRTSKAWGTFKQWSEKDCKINKGEKSSVAVFWQINKYEDKETGKEKKVPLIRYYRVFNSEQVTGDYARQVESEALNTLNEHEAIAIAEQTAQAYLDAEQIMFGNSDIACYIPSLDAVNMPKLGQFKSPVDYYSVLFHELTHSTGAKQRLDREMSGGFGSQGYAKEELVAELGAAMQLANLGLSQTPREDHAIYIKSWLKALNNDNKFIVSASSMAQKACDYIAQADERMNENELELAA